MGLLILGCTGVGKSYISNRIFEAFGSSERFKISGGAGSETEDIQIGTINLGDETVTVVDTPGFYDSNGPHVEALNACRIWKAMESMESISAILFVFTVRFDRATQICFERIVNTLPSLNRDNIILVKNMYKGNETGKYQDIELLRTLTKNAALKVSHIPDSPEDAYIKDLVEQWMSLPKFSIENLCVPEVCYEKDESGPIQERFVKHLEETTIEIRTKTYDHSGFRVVRQEWDGFVGKVIGIKKDVVGWVTDIQTVPEKVPITKYIGKQWQKYQNIYRVRFDGTKDFKEERTLEFFLK